MDPWPGPGPTQTGLRRGQGIEPRDENYFNMAPFLVRMQPFESYESLLSYGTVLVTHRAVLKNLRKYGENGSNILQGRRLLYNDLDAH